MDKWLEDNLACPRDHDALKLTGNTLVCRQGHEYRCVDGVPIMLLEEAEPTHVECSRTLERAKADDSAWHPIGDASDQDAIPAYVQNVIAATCGSLYKHLVNRMTRYPIPELRLPQASGQYFLEVGSNWGRWCISAARSGYVPIGVDPSLKAIKAAREVARQLGVAAHYVVADARYLPFAKGCLDVVFSYSVLQHLDRGDVLISLGEFARVLKASGISLVQMPNTFGMRNLYVQLRRGFQEGPYFDVHYWKPWELKKTFDYLIGPTALSVDGFFSLNPQKSDMDLFPLRYRVVLHCSEYLRAMSEKMKWLKYFADSLYVTSIRKPVDQTGLEQSSVPRGRVSTAR